MQDGLALVPTPSQQPSEHWPLAGLVLGDRTGKVEEMALSPDGALIASVGSDGTLRFWEPAASRSPVRTLHHDRPVLALDFHVGRRLLATACQDGSVWLWKPAAGRSAEPERLSSGISDVRAVAFAPGGDGLLAIAGLAGFGRKAIELWQPDRNGTWFQSPSARFLLDEDTGMPPPPGTRVGRFSGYQLRESFGGHTNGVDALAFSPASGLLATAGIDGTVRLWDLVGRPAAGPLSGHEGPVRTIAFSPDGRRIASGGADGTVRLWDPVAASPTGRPLTAHTGPVRCLAFSPDGQLVASAGDDATVRFWSPADGRPLGEPLIGRHGPVTGVSFAPNGGLLSTTGNGQDGTTVADPGGLTLHRVRGRTRPGGCPSGGAASRVPTVPLTVS
ncbi:WD40 repeat domain-containing protein [Streptomyces sp. NPDC046859]|uniref:WD40 repeat domain-containing protein n=1 Tax=Streptomyces sp. NPDC046859 TaxID=3155734 RepID=UPI0033E4DFEE